MLITNYVLFIQIEELLQQGKGTGQYAQMLREILRKMSKDDSQLQLKSLEQVLQLGHSIAQQDSQERLGEARLASRSGASGSGSGSGAQSSNPAVKKTGKTPSPRRGRPPANGYADDSVGLDPSAAHEDPFAQVQSSQAGHAHSRNSRETAQPHKRADLSQYTSVASNGRAGTGSASGGVISRLAKVPGQTPDPTAKKIKKVNLLYVPWTIS